MSTIGSLMLELGRGGPSPYGDIQAQTAQTRGHELGNETALLKLAELKRSQASEEMVMAAIQKDPDLARLFFGEAALGQLGQAPGGPPPAAAGPLTQQSVLPGQPPGAPQVVPGGQDLSRYANVSPQGGGPIPPDVMAQTMPQVSPPPQGMPTLATLGPQGGMPGAMQGPPQPPQNPALEMARTNPRAAMMLQQQLQARQEQRLKMSTTILDSLGRRAQGATDQASWDLFRQDAASIDPRMAAQLPQVYSKEARDRVVAQALDVKETMTQRLEARKLDVLTRGQDVELAKAQQTGGKVNYQTDANGNIVVVPEYAPGGGPVQSRPVLGADGQPMKSLEGQKLTTEQQRHMAGVESGLRTHVDVLLAPLYAARDAIGRIEQSADTPSAAGDLALITAFMQMIDPRTGVKDAEFRNAQGTGGILDRVQGYIGKLQQGTLLDTDVRADFLQRARKLYEQYDKDYGQVKQQYRDLASRMGGNPANVVLESGSTAAKPPGGAAGGGGQTGTFSDADIAATMANPRNTGKTRQQIVDGLLAKGMTYR